MLRGLGHTGNNIDAVFLYAVDDALNLSAHELLRSVVRALRTSSAYVPLWSQVRRVHLSSRATTQQLAAFDP